jgi:hypothetical protein
VDTNVVINDRPNLQPEQVPVENVSSGLDSIANKMAAMKEQTLRNQMLAPNQTETGSVDAAADTAPVAPEGTTVDSDSDAYIVEPEVDAPEAEYSESSDEDHAPEEVSRADSSAEDLIDFLEFAETNPNAKFKFMRNGKEIVVDAKKAAAILGQGAAISEDARQLKIEKAEFDEYLQTKRAETEGLFLAMEFTVAPQLRKAYDEIVKTQGYQNTFQQQLAQTTDPATQARIRANMQQNEQYIAQQAQVVNSIKPQVQQFYDVRKQQVSGILESNRKNFKDKELKNEYVYKEVRSKIAEGWESANNQLVPGIPNIDLISADEHILSLLRDGLKYRDKPKAKSAGGSIAALTQKRSGSIGNTRSSSDVESLREKAKGGDKKAADNLLVAQLQSIRAARNTRGR